MPDLITPLGGVLVNRNRLTSAEDGSSSTSAVLSLRVSENAAADLELLGNGAYSPLNGFLTRADYESVVHHAQLADGTPWTLPITFSVSRDAARTLKEGEAVSLHDGGGLPRGTLVVREVFQRDAEVEAREVYRTTDPAHPGVRALLAEGDMLIGGEVEVTSAPEQDGALTPAETRAEFVRRGWSAVVAFQTRNPVHRAHEYLTKVALEQVDGLLLHPLSGATKDDDVPLDVRVRCYRALLDRYYPQERTVLSLFPAPMRYAGPREAVYHGLVRRNYGCSHFIIGRDAAGVGNYYGSYDAQHLYDELGGVERLGYVAVKFDHAFYCRTCAGMASTKTCPHGDDARVILSGTRVREMLTRGEPIPEEFTRPEVAAILREAYAEAARAGSV